jgi:hypothetical protein
MDNLSIDVDLLALQPSNDPAAVAAKSKEYQNISRNGRRIWPRSRNKRANSSVR